MSERKFTVERDFVMDALKEQASHTAVATGVPANLLETRIVNDGRCLWEQYLTPKARKLYEWCAELPEPTKGITEQSAT